MGTISAYTVNPGPSIIFLLWPTAKGPCNYLSCCCSSSSVHLVILLLVCTSGLNLAAGLGPCFYKNLRQSWPLFVLFSSFSHSNNKKDSILTLKIEKSRDGVVCLGIETGW